MLETTQIKKYLHFMLPGNFRSQVGLLMLLLTTIAFALYALNTSRQQSRFIVDSITSTAIALSQNLAFDCANLLMVKDYASLEVLLRQYAKLPNVTGLNVVNAKGKSISKLSVTDGQVVANYDHRFEEQLWIEQYSELTNDDHSLSVWEPIVVGREPIGVVELNFSLEQAFQERRRLLLSTLGFGFLTTLAVLLFMFLYFRKPLKAIQDASEFASTLDTRRGEKIEVMGFAREFKQLGQALNLVSQKLLEQEQQVQASSAEAKKLAMVASKTNNAVIITNAKEEIEWVNAGFEKMTGYSSGEIIGKRPASFLQGPDTDPDIRHQMRERLSAQESCELEVINYSKSGIPYWVNIAVQPVFDDDGVLRNFIAIESDVTERKKAERQLYEAKTEAEKANLAKSEFLSRMSHELRTPLNAILGFTQLLELDDLGKDNQDFVERILKAGQHLLVLINDVLDISKIESGGMTLSREPVVIKEAAENVLRLVQPLAESHQVTLSIHQNFTDDLLVLGDLQRINQVLVNLLSNAIKYNHVHGTVIINASVQGSERLRLSVEDTGQGIATDKMDRLFTPFDRLGAEQTSIDGSGIGLSLSRQLLFAMDGTIGVCSTAGKGTTVWIELPIAHKLEVTVPMIMKTPQVENAGSEQRPPATIIYIEDNTSNVALVEKVLERLGNIDLQVAMQGLEGLELIRAAKPDLVLLDLHLPVLGGEEVLERMRENPDMHSIPVIIVSADATPEHIERLLHKGANDYITKPLDVQDLLDHVRKFIDA
ncbi:hybrid sensor histidine kinase/response regulator [Granulosicoccus antarcticus]|uniref:histidine kinase n=1 Tax=Granulosicoccus antarcticus IMCC3135 TaxID=1192854 RepID=A0A2Z2NT38_9GAMM|nr:ATP-binding protein [Granulosicoccus antarcticus]ASJ71910.1 Autoinducer 2 sensor kinase/phosphatase LuxQ [Granulosicoccus antarcticus IMCC3135]